jgi:hypothetical protein
MDQQLANAFWGVLNGFDETKKHRRYATCLLEHLLRLTQAFAGCTIDNEQGKTECLTDPLY